ncbi:LCP family protein [Streptomyces sp. Li-HN-5-11]|uniref:LCP family protein n=1 Tax=Streptomyces sp. Li-HN-5-11 TaxID=3075432 RepID=UPI0028B25704|nr:LCP family protein [Streptomyces sp. Li-HN-5-11]WNM35540.1 LCP family protein [Streptomyces sp. Li-HN-5-11]
MTQSSVRAEGTRRAQGLDWAATRPQEDETAPDGDGPGRGRGGGSGFGGGRRHGGGRRGGGKRRVLRWSATTLALLILGTAAAGYLYYEHLADNIRKGERSSGDSKAQKTKPNAAGQTPLNILLIGSDSRNSDEDVALGGSRDNRGDPPLGDVQMLVHLSADRKSASVVSIPRDTRVDIPKCTDPKTGKVYPPINTIINESLARGGAGCTLATWQNLTHVYIDHWMTIDFAGVVRMADAIGGVDVCVNQNVWDRSTARQRGGSGLKLTAGTHKVKGEQALQWLRTRHAWGSDLLRARAQHIYLNSMIRTLKSENVFTDSGRLMDLADAATKALSVSQEIGTPKKLYDLGMQLKSVPTDRITMTTMPNVPDPQNSEHVVPDGANADRMWQMLRDDVAFDANGKDSAAKQTPSAQPSPSDPADPDNQIGVTVQNGTRTSTLAPVSHRATDISQVLVQKGFTRAAADASVTPSADQTVVRYPSAELKGDAEQVAKALGIPAGSVEKSTDVSGVTVVVGADWRTGTSFPKQSTPKAGQIPKNSDAINGADTSQCMDVYAPYRW